MLLTKNNFKCKNLYQILSRKFCEKQKKYKSQFGNFVLPETEEKKSIKSQKNINLHCETLASKLDVQNFKEARQYYSKIYQVLKEVPQSEYSEIRTEILKKLAQKYSCNTLCKILDADYLIPYTCEVVMRTYFKEAKFNQGIEFYNFFCSSNTPNLNILKLILHYGRFQHKTINILRMVLTDTKKYSIKPDIGYFEYLLELLTADGDIEHLEEAYSILINLEKKFSISPNFYCFCIIIEKYAKRGNSNRVFELIDLMQNKYQISPPNQQIDEYLILLNATNNNLANCLAIIENKKIATFQNEYCSFRFFALLVKNGIVTTENFIENFLNAFSLTAKEIHFEILITDACEKSKLNDAVSILHAIPKSYPNIKFTDNLLNPIVALLVETNLELAIDFVKRMEESFVKPTYNTCKIIISALPVSQWSEWFVFMESLKIHVPKSYFEEKIIQALVNLDVTTALRITKHYSKAYQLSSTSPFVNDIQATFAKTPLLSSESKSQILQHFRVV